MSSTLTRDIPTLAHFCGLQLKYGNNNSCSDLCSNSSLTQQTIHQCHGRSQCDMDTSPVGSNVLIRTVYNCVPPGVINMDSLVPSTTTTTTTLKRTTSVKSSQPTKILIGDIQNDQVL